MGPLPTRTEVTQKIFVIWLGSTERLPFSTRIGTLFTFKKALAPGEAHSESTSAAFSHSTDKRQKQVSPVYHAAARSPDAELDSQPDSPRPVESELNTYNSGNVHGLVASAHAELSRAFHATIDLIASQLANGHLQFFDIDHGTCKSIFLQQVRRGLELALNSN